MKKIISITLTCFIFLFVLASCIFNVDNKVEGLRGSSKDIAEAKKRGTYIQAYCLIKNDIDSLNIKEAFIEKGFGYGESLDSTRAKFFGYLEGRYQFTVKIEKGMDDIYARKYALIVQDTKYMNYFSTYSLYCPLQTLNLQDSLKVYVLNKVNEKGDTIGVLTFVKCNK